MSIHAPREGCDFSDSADKATETQFQFTHPGRGATSLLLSQIDLDSCFNSRTPGGVRLKQGSLSDIYRAVSIHAPREGCDILSADYP